MIYDGESGISCQECGYEQKALTKEEEDKLEKKLEWSNGDPICPECTHTAWFESYID